MNNSGDEENIVYTSDDNINEIFDNKKHKTFTIIDVFLFQWWLSSPQVFFAEHCLNCGCGDAASCWFEYWSLETRVEEEFPSIWNYLIKKKQMNLMIFGTRWTMFAKVFFSRATIKLIPLNTIFLRRRF